MAKEKVIKVPKREAHLEGLRTLFAPYLGKPLRFKIITNEDGEAQHDFPIVVSSVEVQNTTGFTLVDKRSEELIETTEIKRGKRYTPPLAKIVTDAGSIILVVEDLTTLAVMNGIEIRAGEYKYRFEEVQ